MNLLLAALALLPQTNDPVAREWEVRERAFLLGSRSEWVAEALAADDWRDRAAALDALARGWEAGAEIDSSLTDLVAVAFRDPHPSVRAAALRAQAATGTWTWGRATARFTQDPLPAVRLEFARALGAASFQSQTLCLAELAHDPDVRVARAARRSILGIDGTDCPDPIEMDELDSSGFLQALLLRDLNVEELHPELIEAAVLLGRGRPGAGWTEFNRGLETGLEVWPEASRSEWAVLESIVFRALGEGDAKVLVDGWLAPLAGLPDQAVRLNLLTLAGDSGNTALGELLLTALHALGTGAEPAELPEGFLHDARALRATADEESLPAARESLFDAALRALGPRGLAQRMALLSLTPETSILLLDALGRRLDSWEAEWATPWLFSEQPLAVRKAAVDALAMTLSATADETAAGLLAGLLADDEAELARVAFRALGQLDEPPLAVARSLHAYFTAAEPASRARLLTRLSRTAPLLPFREELLRRGARPGPERRPAVELLAPFEGDAGVRAALTAWLAEELDGLGASEADARRKAEAEAKGILRALARVAPSAAAPALAEAAERSLGVSVEVGKTAAWALGRSKAGRELLARLLADDVDRRTRIEAGIGLAPNGDARAVAVLCADYPHAAWDLRGRMLRALARAPGAAAFEFLRTATVAPGHEPEQRLAAVDALAGRKEPGVLDALVLAASASPEFEARRQALRRLGERETATAAAALARLAAQFEEVPGESGELLREELRVARAACGPLPPELEAEWLAAPLAAAALELDQRFHGTRLARPDFTWRGPVEIAGHLARHGRLAAALDAAGPWWTLDGRLLAALADSALATSISSHPAVRDLTRAALIALAGEPRPDKARATRLRLRLLALNWRAPEHGSWGRAARISARLLRDWRSGDVPDGTWSAALGVLDRDRGIDPRARLESSVHQARAWAALERGDRETAESEAARATTRLGHSTRAAHEQALLAAALAD